MQWGDGTGGDNQTTYAGLFCGCVTRHQMIIAYASSLGYDSACWAASRLTAPSPAAVHPAPNPSPYPQPADAAAALPADAYVVASPCPATASAAPGSRATAVFTVGASLNPEQFKEVALQVDFPKALWPTASLSCQTASSKGEQPPCSSSLCTHMHAHQHPGEPWSSGPASRTQPHQVLTDLPALLLCALPPTHPTAPAHSHHMRCARAQRRGCGQV